jgi:hypothetical protein
MPTSADLVLAHGVASREDLPLPFGFALVGGLLALVVSFAVLAMRWREPRFRGDAAGRPLPGDIAGFLDSAELRWGLRILGLALTGFVAVAAFFGPDLATNPTAGLVYAVFWVGLVPASLLCGPIWRYLNPLRTIHLLAMRAIGLDPREGVFRLPAGLGYWPAAVGLFAFVYLELCSLTPDSTVSIRTWFMLYAGVHLVGALLFGSTWFDRGDAFEVFSGFIGRLSVLGRRGDGRIVVRNPLENLDVLAPARGLVAVVAVLLGSTAFDTIRSTPWWNARANETALTPQLFGGISLLVVIGLVAAAFWLACAAAGMLAREGVRGVPTALAHSLVPIAVGYLIAHYFLMLVFAGQEAIARASDPLGTGANLFGTAGMEVDYGILPASVVATVQVLAIVTGHVLGVFAAHDRAVRLFPRGAVAAQVPLTLLMIGYTFAGFSLLFA